MFNITPDEETYLLKQPEVAAALAKFNRAQAMQTADHAKRMQLLDRFRAFEALMLPSARRF